MVGAYISEDFGGGASSISRLVCGGLLGAHKIRNFEEWASSISGPHFFFFLWCVVVGGFSTSVLPSDRCF